MNYSDTLSGSFSESDLDEDVDVNFDIGLKWTITENIGVRAKWEQYKILDEDVDLITRIWGRSAVWGCGFGRDP